MAYDFGQPFRGYQPVQGGFPYQQAQSFIPQQQNAPVAPQAAPQPGFRIQAVASKEEAMAVQTDFFGPGVIMPCLGRGVIYLKRFDQNTGLSDFLEFVYAPPQPKQELSGEFVPMNMFQQLVAKVEQLEKGVTNHDPVQTHE